MPSPSQPVVVVGVTSSQTCLVLRGRLRAFRLAGFRVVLVASPGPLLEAMAASEGVQALPLPMERAISLPRDLLSLFRLWRVLRQIRPAMVEFSTPKAGLLGMLAAWLCRIPHRVYLLRGLKLETSTGLKRSILLAAERLTCRCAHIVIANSASLRDKAHDLQIVAPSKLILLGEGSSRGVDVAYFCPGPSSVRKQLGIPPDAPLLGFVGRITCDKGAPELITAFERVLRESPQARLLLVGWFDAAEDALPEPLRKKIEAHPRILVTGMVDSPLNFYRAMDMMVLPTLREGFPNAVLEASAVGLPVITTLATGARDSVVPELTGLLIPPRSPEAIAQAILDLLGDPERRIRMGKAARSWVTENFIDVHVLALTVKFYKSLLATPSGETEHGFTAERKYSAPDATAACVPSTSQTES